ncbi:MAG: pyridoxamine 5'-phosphate oxidase family protein [Muribaculaceae bacterium]|nr:pyridoxamine 5'-phosphate oxidase family protein [Muribaculaceae bacterium]
MRRADREMSADWALEVLKRAPYVTVSFVDGDQPYAVPLSLAHADGDTLYFHCAQEGKKLDLIARNSAVFLSAVSRCKPVVGPHDNSFTLEFASATACGIASVVTDDAEKLRAMRLICQRFLPRHMDAFDEAVERSLSRTTVVRITLTAPPVGKRKQYDSSGNEMKWKRME